MKILVLTDLHQKISNLTWINSIIERERVENVFFLGDVTDMGTADDAVKIISSIKARVYCLPGNCDPHDLPEKISSVAIDMHGKSVRIEDYYVAGLGGSNITVFDTPFELEEEEIDMKLRPISKKGMILMTHAPPYGILDHIPNGVSVGSPAIRKIVDEYRPAVVLSGHIHEDIGTIEMNGTLFVNPGPAMDGYCAILTLEGGEAVAKLMGPLPGA